MSSEVSPPAGDFLRQIVRDDLANGRHTEVRTRFPPEPNGYLHMGHAKSICLNFGIARDFGGVCHLRLDDTDPTKEESEYVHAIEEDVKWLGFDWGPNEFHASDYFEKLYEFALEFIRDGKAYVDDLNEAQIREKRGTVKLPGEASPWRDRSVEENLQLFADMRAGKYGDGDKVLRAKIDMASPNVKMRDPPMYRIRHVKHHRAGDKWCIYPLYDFTHCFSDSIEGITHSICTLEFENNRELYDWFLNQLPVFKSRQYEFARLNLSHTVMSKRKLLRLVKENYVRGWDDPRMPTISGMRRRGYTPEAIRTFCERIGVGRSDNMVEMKLLEHTLREDLNLRTARRMAVLKPLKVIIDNYPEDGVDEFEAADFPDDPPKMGTRKVPFSKEIYIEESDFMEVPVKKYFRLAPGQEVRLRWAYLITCTSIEKDASGKIIAVHCTYDPATKGGSPPDGRKVKGTIHWVSARDAIDAEVRLYDHLFTVEAPDDESEGKTFVDFLNPASLEVVQAAKLEPSLAKSEVGARFQLERTGYFAVDPDSKPGALVLNRTVPLRDSWTKIAEKSQD